MTALYLLVLLLIIVVIRDGGLSATCRRLAYYLKRTDIVPVVLEDSYDSVIISPAVLESRYRYYLEENESCFTYFSRCRSPPVTFSFFS